MEVIGHSNDCDVEAISPASILQISLVKQILLRCVNTYSESTHLRAFNGYTPSKCDGIWGQSIPPLRSTFPLAALTDVLQAHEDTGMLAHGEHCE